LQDVPDPVTDGQQQTAQGADRRGLGRCRQTGQDRPQDRQNEEGQGKERRHDHDQQAGPANVSDILIPELGRQRRIDHRSADHIDDIKPGKKKARENGAGVKLHDRDIGRRGIDDQHDRGRDQNTQATARADHAGGEAGVVAGLQHGRKSEQAHERDHGADDAGRRSEHRTGRQRRDRHGPRHPPQADLQGVEKPVDDIGAFDDVSHEQKQRDGRQHVVGHHRIGLID
jgi:hypothetical protein